MRAHLRGAPDGPVPVLHRGRHAVYVAVGGRCVGVVGTDATAVPCALRLRTSDLAEIRGNRAYLRGGVLHLDGVPLGIGRIVDVRVPPLKDTAGSVTAQAIPPAAVIEFVGRGDGLTPLGDDILCGWLAVHRAAGIDTPEIDAAVRSCLHRTTLLSATLLDCAIHGEVIPEFAAYVASLGTSAEPDRAATLAAVGHTSGSGMLYGARLALTALQGVAA